MRNEQEIKILFSTKVLNNIKNKAVEGVLRDVIFSHNNSIDWQEVYKIMLEQMPELILEEKKAREN